jgi:hypothetical protein
MGDPAQASTGMAAVWQPDGTQANVFYVDNSGQISNWYWDGSAWSNSVLGNGEPASFTTDLGAGSGMAAVWNPDGTQANVFYVGNNGQICSWFWDGSAWSNSAIGMGEVNGGPAVAAAWHPDGTQANVFYVGGNGQIWNWYWDGSAWTNRVLFQPPEDGHPATPEPGGSGGLAAAWHPTGTQANVFYVGADGQIWNWFWNGSIWTNGVLGAGEVVQDFASASGVAAAWHPDGTQANVFYVGNNGQIWNWYWDGSAWSNSALGTGEPAASFTVAGAACGVAGVWNPDGTQANVFYVDNSGQIWTWFWDGSAWSNSVLGTGKVAQGGTAVAAAWHPDGTQANVFYVGGNGQIWNWFWDGSAWTNNQLSN